MRSARSGSSLSAKMPRLVRGQEAVVDGELVGEVAALRHLDRIHLADEVGDRDVGGGELLAVAPVARDPRDRGPVSLLADALAARRADRGERLVADLAAGQRGHLLVEQPHQQAGHAGLGLAALAEEDDVLAAQHRVLDLGHDGLLVAHDAGEEALAAAQTGDQVVAQLLLDGAGHVPAVAQLSNRGRLRHEGSLRCLGSLCGGRWPLSIRARLDTRGSPVRITVMPMGPGGARWCRLLLIVLLLLPIPAAIDVYADDGWMAVADPDGSDEYRLRIAAGVPSDSAWILPAPTPAGRAVLPDRRDPGRRPLDLPHPDRPRASSRLILSRAPFPSLDSFPFTRGDARHEDHSADDRRPRHSPFRPRSPTSARCCTSR